MENSDCTEDNDKATIDSNLAEVDIIKVTDVVEITDNENASKTINTEKVNQEKSTIVEDKSIKKSSKSKDKKVIENNMGNKLSSSNDKENTDVVEITDDEDASKAINTEKVNQEKPTIVEDKSIKKSSKSKHKKVYAGEENIPNNCSEESPLVDLVDKNCSGLHTAYTEGTVVVQHLQSALKTYRAKTFFKPDVALIKGVTSAISQIENGLQKITQLISSSNNAATCVEPSSIHPITPPASEAGTDTGNDCNTTHDISSSSASNCNSGELSTSHRNSLTQPPNRLTVKTSVNLDTSGSEIIYVQNNNNNTVVAKKKIIKRGPNDTTHDVGISSASNCNGGELSTNQKTNVTQPPNRLTVKQSVILDTSGIEILDLRNNNDPVVIKKRVYKRGSTGGKKGAKGKKRQRESSEEKESTIAPATKRLKRSLLTDFLTKTEKESEDKAQSSDDSDTEDGGVKEGEFEVERILDYNKVKGRCVYQVRWRKYGPDDDTWEPLSNLTGCEDILLTFMRSRLVERSRATTADDLKSLLLPCEEGLRPLLRTAVFAQLTAPLESDVIAAVPLLVSGKHRVKEMHELDDDIDKLVATKDCLSERYTKMFADLKQQLVLRECKQRRERQEADLRRWQREMSRICLAPAPLTVINEVDLSLPPKDFVYINDYVPGKGIIIPQDPMVGCECTDCGNSQKSCCPKQMSSHFAYNKYGRLKVSIGTAIYECNKMCRCIESGNCHNRVVQNGRKIKLTIFRTANNRGWGVKAGEALKAGTFVTEYVGEVISSEEAERRGQIYDARGCTYLFDLDYDKGDQNPYTVDAAKYGNVSHFINHSCDPNLVVFNVWINCLDPDLPKLALFATRDIKKGEELSFDYNTPSSRPASNAIREEELCESSLLHDTDSPALVADADCGSIDMAVRKTPKRGINNGKTECHCGAPNCRRFFF